jgi:hypothetical protein
MALRPFAQSSTHPVKTAEMVVDNALSVVIGGDYAAAFC